MPKRTNDLGGTAWARNSISIWSDIRKTPEEVALKHPAMFPVALAARLIECFTTSENRTVLDPFAGVGSTLLATRQLGGTGIGIELSPEFADIAQRRLKQQLLTDNPPAIIHCADARDIAEFVAPATIDLIVTSPPYWDILLRRRTADGKTTRHYGDTEADLGKINDYHAFLESLGEILKEVLATLKPGGYCCTVVMDIRKKAVFYPFHSDLAAEMQRIGFIFDDMIIWDRRHEYNSLRPLGYPSVFRINKTHEYILIFQKPKTG